MLPGTKRRVLLMFITPSNFSAAHLTLLGVAAPMTNDTAHALAVRIDKTHFGLLQQLLQTPRSFIAIMTDFEQFWCVKTAKHSWLQGRDFPSMAEQRAEAEAIARDPQALQDGRLSWRKAYPYYSFHEAGVIPGDIP